MLAAALASIEWSTYHDLKESVYWVKELIVPALPSSGTELASQSSTLIAEGFPAEHADLEPKQDSALESIFSDYMVFLR